MQANSRVYITEARYKELLEAAPPFTSKEWKALKDFTPRFSELTVSVGLALGWRYINADPR